MNFSKHKMVLLTAGLMVLAGCGSNNNEGEGFGQGGGQSAASMTALGTATISGKVTLTGKAPVPASIGMDADPVCKSQHEKPAKDETVMVGPQGGLANVFVYVTDAGNVAPPAAPVTLLQKGCMYIPHVFGLQVGQPLEIINDDPTLHNIHCMAVTNDSFNVGQPAKGDKSEKKFTKPEVLIKFKCDVHSWMHCYAGVTGNPFFSVTDKSGGFKISQLPAGTYTVVAVHEKYGPSQPQKVTVADGSSRTLNFSFAAP